MSPDIESRRSRARILPGMAFRWDMLIADLPDQREVREASNQSGYLADELNSAAATVDIAGTTEARAAARAVYEGAKTVSGVYQARSLNLATAERRIGIPRGSGLTSFHADKARARSDVLSDAIDSFITAVRPEFRHRRVSQARDTPGIRE